MSNLTNAALSSLPTGFVYLEDYAPTIIDNLAYFTEENFVGQVVDGYYANKSIGTKQMAQALVKAVDILNNKGFDVIIYDTYRPQKAVDHFVRWSLDSTSKAKAKYYPTVDKANVFDLGFIAKKSGHSRGSTVDLSIIKKEKKLKKIEPQELTLKNGDKILWLDDNSLFMGSSFDLFHDVSYHNTDLISDEATANRQILLDAMLAANFVPYAKEWWHYTLADEPFSDKYFDFDVK